MSVRNTQAFGLVLALSRSDRSSRLRSVSLGAGLFHLVGLRSICFAARRCALLTSALRWRR
jgi:hypothetical protein